MKGIAIIIIAIFTNLTCIAQGQLVQTKTKSGKNVKFVLHIPKGYDASRTYPVAVGPSDFDDMDGSYYWKDFKSNDSWILVDAEIYKGTSQIESMVAIKDYLSKNYSIEGEKFHAVCFSANSSPVFKLVMATPELFHSVTGMPAGVSASDVQLNKLKNVKVQLLVGEDDGYWLRSSKSLNQRLEGLGIDTRIEIFPDVGHFLILVRGQPLMDRLDKLRPKS